MKKYLISTLALSSILVFGACSELEDSEEEEIPEDSEGTAEAEEEEPQPLSPEELAEEVFGDDLLQNEYNEDENVLSVDLDFGDPWLYGRSQSNAESDMTELLEELAALDTVPAASFDFIGEVEDIEGNESEDSALVYEFESETVSSIDYEEFDSDDLQETADLYWSHEEELEVEAQAEEERLEEEEAEAERLEEEQAAEEERLEQEEAEREEAEAEEQERAEQERIEEEEAEAERIAQEEQEREEEEQRLAEEEQQRAEEEANSPENVINEISEEVFEDELIETEYHENNNHANIYVNLGESFTVNTAKTGSYINVTDFLKEIQGLEGFNSVYVEFEATFTNEYGEENNNQALTYDFEKDTIDQINFDNFMHTNIPEVADHYWEHPAFAE